MPRSPLHLWSLALVLMLGCTGEPEPQDSPEPTDSPSTDDTEDTSTDDSADSADSADSDAPDPELPRLSVEGVDADAYEGGGDPAEVALVLDAPQDADLTVTYTWSGSAAPDADYTLSCEGTCTATSATLPAGETRLTLRIDPVVSADLEVQETLTVTLDPTDAAEVVQATATVRLHEHGPSHGAVYYVSPDGSDDASGTEDAPFGTLNHAASVLTPGDTLYLLDGTYTADNYVDDHGPTGDVGVKHGVLATLSLSGTPDAWITIAAAPDGNDVRPRLLFDGSGGIQLKSGSSYVRIEGLEVEGPNAEITYAWAHEHRWSKENFYIGRGIFSWGPVHHIVIRDCVVHHTPGSGIRFNKSDYIRVENSVVSNTTWWSSSAESAIVIATAVSIDEEDAVKFLYANNRVYNNWNFMEFCQTGFEGSTEDAYGNCDQYSGGIIDGQGLYVTRNNDTYTHGRMRFENNVAYNNGFGGVVYHKTDRGELANNLIFMNGAYPGVSKYSGLSVNTVEGLSIVNNVIWAREADHYGLKNNGNANDVVATHNVVVGKSQFGDSTDNQVLAHVDVDGASFFVDVGDLSGARPDPHATEGDSAPANIDATVQALVRDFSATGQAPQLLDQGTLDGAPSTDFDGVVRPQGAGVDIGPYEWVE